MSPSRTHSGNAGPTPNDRVPPPAGGVEPDNRDRAGRIPGTSGPRDPTRDDTTQGGEEGHWTQQEILNF